MGGRHAVEGGGRRHGVGSHVPEEEPLTHAELGEGTVLQDTVQTVAGRSPHTAAVGSLLALLERTES